MEGPRGLCRVEPAGWGPGQGVEPPRYGFFSAGASPACRIKNRRSAIRRFRLHAGSRGWDRLRLGPKRTAPAESGLTIKILLRVDFVYRGPTESCGAGIGVQVAIRLGAESGPGVESDAGPKADARPTRKGNPHAISDLGPKTDFQLTPDLRPQAPPWPHHKCLDRVWTVRTVQCPPVPCSAPSLP